MRAAAVLFAGCSVRCAAADPPDPYTRGLYCDGKMENATWCDRSHTFAQRAALLLANLS
eukprot:gene52341-65616_t